MTDDALAPYRLDQPLTQDEEAVVRIAAVEEHLAQGGVTVQRREDGCYLSFSQGNSDNKHVVVRMITRFIRRHHPTLDTREQLASRIAKTAQDLQNENDIQRRKLSVGAWHLALRLALAVWGEEASNALIYLANLAFCLDKLGRSTEALPLHQHALDLLRKVLGKRHPETLSSLHNQALCLMSLERAAEALPLLEQALAGRREVLGERHPDTLTILNNQAACLRDLNQTAEALSLDQQALALRREVLGERHPDTLISLSNNSSDSFWKARSGG